MYTIYECPPLHLLYMYPLRLFTYPIRLRNTGRGERYIIWHDQMSFDSNIPSDLWANTKTPACYLHNKCPSHSQAINGRILQLLWTQNSVENDNLKSLAKRLGEMKQKEKLGKHAQACVFICYLKVKGYELWNVENECFC